MTTQAPRAFNREMSHDHSENVFYATDDGNQDGSFSEFATFRKPYDQVLPERCENIHTNPTAITYFRIIPSVWITSRDVQHFKKRLTNGDYDAETEAEEFVRETFA